MSTVTLTAIYNELKFIRKDVEIMKRTLLPEEKISAKECRELQKIRKEMESGKEKGFEEIFSK